MFKKIPERKVKSPFQAMALVQTLALYILGQTAIGEEEPNRLSKNTTELA